jgi:hypothetical protein
VLPTKSCDILDVTNDRPCLGNTRSNKTWVLHIPLLCFTTLSLKMMGRYLTYLHQVIFNLFWVEISQSGNKKKCSQIWLCHPLVE